MPQVRCYLCGKLLEKDGKVLEDYTSLTFGIQTKEVCYPCFRKQIKKM